jgi:glycerol-3-phosphate dehydrogenase
VKVIIAQFSVSQIQLMSLRQLIRTCSSSISRNISKRLHIASTSHLKSTVKLFSDLPNQVKMTQNLQEFILENNSPFEELDCREAFDNLTEKERKYLHFYTKVSVIVSSQLVHLLTL